MAPAIPSYAGTCRKTVVCAVAGLTNLTDQICLTCCPRRTNPNQNETGEGKMSDYDDWEIVDFKPP